MCQCAAACQASGLMVVNWMPSPALWRTRRVIASVPVDRDQRSAFVLHGVLGYPVHRDPSDRRRTPSASRVTDQTSEGKT